MPSRRSIRNGEYDNFWSKQFVYENPSNPNYSSNHTFASALMAAAATPTTLTSTSRKDFWASVCEMNYMKDNDKSYPHYVGATCPQTP